MTVEIVELGQPKPSPYAKSTPEERLAAAVRLIDQHQTFVTSNLTWTNSA